jgi:hypothetical protein
MKASISKGAGFSGLCRYVLDIKKGSKGEKEAEVIGGNMAGESYSDVMSQFAAVRRIRPDIKRPVWHCSLSFPPGEKLNNGTLANIADEFMKAMDFSNECPFVVIKHNDKAHNHIHIVASRIGLDGTVWSSRLDVFRALKITQVLEERFNLTKTLGFNENAERKNLKFSERQMEARTGEAPPKLQLQEIIDEIVATKPTVVDFCEYLEASGVEVRANLAHTGRLNGFSFLVNGVAFKGSNLGKVYTWGQLKDRGVSYEPERDLEGLKRFAALSQPVAGESKGQAEVGGPSEEVAVKTKKVFPSTKEKLKDLILEAAAGRPSVLKFCELLKEKEVEVQVNLAQTGHLSGVSFLIDGVVFKGSSLGKAFSWGGLQKQGVTYELERDMAGLEKFKLSAPVKPPSMNDRVDIGDGTNDVAVNVKEPGESHSKEVERRKLQLEREAWIEAEEEAFLNRTRKNNNYLMFCAYNIKSDVNLPSWIEDSFDVQRSSFSDATFLFSKTDSRPSKVETEAEAESETEAAKAKAEAKAEVEAVLVIRSDSIMFYRIDEKALLKGLELATDMWKERSLLMRGDDDFKAKLRAVVKQYNINVTLVDGNRQEQSQDQSQSPRPRF